MCDRSEGSKQMVMRSEFQIKETPTVLTRRHRSATVFKFQNQLTQDTRNVRPTLEQEVKNLVGHRRCPNPSQYIRHSQESSPHPQPRRGSWYEGFIFLVVVFAQSYAKDAKWRCFLLYFKAVLAYRTRKFAPNHPWLVTSTILLHWNRRCGWVYKMWWDAEDCRLRAWYACSRRQENSLVLTSWHPFQGGVAYLWTISVYLTGVLA